ncbi:MAG: NAD(P)H-dependent oxidoreductase [Deltaproteobacteria bacterium]|nr:NAD(P)H-dependent oxidoreductase [Deltaproteobacteria bacterium]
MQLDERKHMQHIRSKRRYVKPIVRRDNNVLCQLSLGLPPLVLPLYSKMKRADAIVIASPVYWFSLSAIGVFPAPCALRLGPFLRARDP